jgi:hypothetical protein
MSDVTLLLNAIGHSDRRVADALHPDVYEELGRLDRVALAQDRSHHALRVYLRLLGDDAYGSFADLAADGSTALLAQMFDARILLRGNRMNAAISSAREWTSRRR